MISLVSAAVNGNDIPDKYKETPEFLWPRQCDRLEALGRTGIARCYLYNLNKTSRPLYCEKTPRVRTELELWDIASEERLTDYKKRGSSESMLCHYFDKLLRVAILDPETTQNDWLVQEGRNRVKDLVSVCLNFGNTGSVDMQLIADCVSEYQKAVNDICQC